MNPIDALGYAVLYAFAFFGFGYYFAKLTVRGEKVK